MNFSAKLFQLVGLHLNTILYGPYNMEFKCNPSNWKSFVEEFKHCVTIWIENFHRCNQAVVSYNGFMSGGSPMLYGPYHMAHIILKIWRIFAKKKLWKVNKPGMSSYDPPISFSESDALSSPIVRFYCQPGFIQRLISLQV